MRRHAPITLRLPSAHGQGASSLRRLLSAATNRSGRRCVCLIEQFAMTGPERAFAQAVLQRKTNLWLFRTNQRRFAGDFVVVDMSARGARPGTGPGTSSGRRAWVLELKAAEPVRPAGGVQLRRARDALDEIAAVHGILPLGAPAVLLRGDPKPLLEALGVPAPAAR